MDLYTSTVSVFIRNLENLRRLLEKAEKFSKQKKIPPKKLLEGKLAPDMYNLTQQVGYAYFIVLEAAGNLTGKKPPHFTYDETSFVELKKSLGRTIAFLKTIKPRDFKGADKKKVVSHLQPKKKLSAQKYVFQAIMPNFFFHYTVIYAILRNLRVPLTKEDYIGEL